MDGTMVADIIGSKDNVDIKWDYLSDADLKLLAKEIESGIFVTITFNTAEQEELKTITVRAEELTYMPYYDWAKAKPLWQSVLVSFVER